MIKSFLKVLMICFVTVSCSKKSEDSLHYSASNTTAKIEGSSDSVLLQHQDIAKSIVKIYNPYTSRCTAALIASDVLLTAAHCRGAMALHNDIVHIGTAEAELVDLKVSTNSDVALMKFKPNSQTDKLFQGAQILPVSLFNTNPGYDGLALMIGYGLTGIEKNNNNDVLHAGYNYIVEGNPFLKAAYDEANKDRPWAKTEPIFSDTKQFIHTLGLRKTNFTNTFEPNQDVQVEDVFVDQEIGLNQAAAQPGDSGGPIIIFKDNKPLIVGVASLTGNYSPGSTVFELNLKDNVTGVETLVKFENIINFDTKAEGERFFKALTDNGFVTVVKDASDPAKDQYLAAKSFSYTYKMNRVNTTSYTATDYEVNSKFISETLKAFGH